MNTRLRCEAVCLRYGRTAALHDVTFAVDAAEVVGLVGPNGAGKTSIARIAAGFTEPTSGRAVVEGLTARTYRVRHGVGYAPEELPRPGAWSVRTLLAMRGRPPDAVAASYRSRLLDVLGVRPLLDVSLRTLSKGQWRAVLLAFAARDASSLVILDEPDSGLDPGALDRLAEFVGMLRDGGASVLLLSHQLSEIGRTSDRVLFVRAGRIAAEEPGHAGANGLRNRYREVFS